MRGTASVVTGAGKTYFAFLCMVEFLHTFPHGRALIVVPTTALVDQWHVSLQEDLGVPSTNIAVYSGEEKADSPAQVNLLVINTARGIIRDVASGAPTFIIVDECHRSGSPVNARALSGKHAASLGLSATPVREYDNAFQEVIEPALGPIIFEYDYEAALHDGVVAPFNLVNVRVELLPHEEHKYSQLTRRIAQESERVTRHGVPDEKLKRLLRQRAAVSTTAAMRVPVAAKLADLNTDSRTLIFHERISDADAIATILAQRDHNVALYHTGIGPTVRRDNLRLYRRGLFDILVTCRALDEGLNVPETSIAIVASSTASQRQRIQRLGRVLRPAPGKPSSTVISIYATDVEERRLVSEAQALLGVASVTWQHGARRASG
jgi:superfamily II DNA or RNA helicase